MMAKSTNALFTGRITEAQDQSPPSLTSGLQHTAGPYIGSFATEMVKAQARPCPNLLQIYFAP